MRVPSGIITLPEIIIQIIQVAPVGIPKLGAMPSTSMILLQSIYLYIESCPRSNGSPVTDQWERLKLQGRPSSPAEAARKSGGCFAVWHVDDQERDETGCKVGQLVHHTRGECLLVSSTSY